MIRVIRDLRALPNRRKEIRRKDIYQATSLRPINKLLSLRDEILSQLDEDKGL